LQLSGNAVSTLTSDAASGSDASNTAGQLLAGDLGGDVDKSAGTFTPQARARGHDGIVAMNGLVHRFGGHVAGGGAENAGDATTVIHRAAASGAGGAADGVLGCEDAGGITLVQGWSWYTGADAAAVGAGQYDFETIVMHELGHALGLGHSADANSVMY